MATVFLHLIGANVYVPHDSGTRLLAVLPNATRLGQSPDAVRDATRPATHLPVVYEEGDVGGRLAIVDPRPFPGARLTFDFGVNPPLDLAAIDPLAALGWFNVGAAVLSNAPGDGVAGQILVSAGVASVYVNPVAAGPCNPAWSPADPGKSLAPVVLGLTFEVNVATRVRATATPWVGGGPQVLLDRPLGTNDVANVFAGNLCAEDILDWADDSPAGRIVDNDFKWLLGLTPDPDITNFLNTRGVLPAPEVDAGPILESDPVATAFRKILDDGGGGAGCQCQGCVDKPRSGF